MGKSQGQSTSSKSRRETVLRNVPKDSFSISSVLQNPEVVRTSFIIFLFLIVVSSLATWTREQVTISDGQIATNTRITRLDYEVEDIAATEVKREEARNASPRIYTVNQTYIDRLHASLLGLPAAVEGKKLEDVNPELATQFGLNEETLRAIQGKSIEGQATTLWVNRVAQLTRELQRRNPILSNDEFQVFITTLPANRALFEGAGRFLTPYQAEAAPLPANVGDPADHRIFEFVSRAGFQDNIVPVIVNRLVSEHLPSVELDLEDTQARAVVAADAVEPVIAQYRRGDIIWKRGDEISAQQYEDALREQLQFSTSASMVDRWFPRIGSIGLLAMLSIFIGIYTTITFGRIARNPLRLFALCTLMALMLAITVTITLQAPVFLYAAAIVPTMLAVTIATLAYGQRMGLFIAFMQCALVTMSLSQPIAWFVLLIAGNGTLISQLKEVRNRQTLIRASGLTAVVIGFGAIFLAFAEIPDLSMAWKQQLFNAIVAAVSALIVGFFVLGILPSIERVFDITTGMTLADLRDPRNPLLKQLQQLAPGTFNHSRQVADIAESATEAIGGDSLLAYVGGLYHDIGKMNKPEYFVENQSGYNRHRELKPSMSLLIIIGHVKDGIELAKEYDLPREIIHFIEAHHGTSLVEYFYHAAMKDAEESGEPINEVQFRYPGPKPRTKEAAILMIADSVESASRVLPDPNPARIEALVRDLSRKRLLDHQYDECGLTFSELAKIEDAIIARLNSIYHTRIKYPDAEIDEEEIEHIEEDGELLG
ncbi:MAG: HDIG domain-containing protein [Phycisphaerales bacterium]|nr:HDIG domain-containing protein [Phycisphaerales bacterium]